MTKIRVAVSPADVAAVRDLFLEYANWLGDDVCFQGFQDELAGLPGQYAEPGGRLLLALVGENPAGCVAMRPTDDPVACEMARLYVRPSQRGQSLGRRLIEQVIDAARDVGYSRIRLHTLPVMVAARQLYARVGFVEIDAYVENPPEGVVYMELDLSVWAPG